MRRLGFLGNRVYTCIQYECYEHEVIQLRKIKVKTLHINDLYQ